MEDILESKGIVRAPHQTPLEFAVATGMPEAVSVTENYNRIRFGEENLSDTEADNIEEWLMRLKTNLTGETENCKPQNPLGNE
ncbi:MAG: DUF4129 domain-containing protein, partial [Acidobacteria bacterium]|nr:DUF4129 domain-containing protein [Acidobacteriota bacterium]